jgi:DNA mismatch endonuclease (patch repair protein)
MHRCLFGQVKPATHKKFWQVKRRSNVERDEHNLKKLRLAGWKILFIWECQTRDLKQLSAKLAKFLKP